MITIRQIDAGLALLGLGRSDLAVGLGLNKSTLNAYFTGQSSVPSGRLAEIQKWLEDSGIVFTEDEGVRMNKAEIVRYEGQQGFISFMKDVVDVAKHGGGTDICISNVNEADWESNLPIEFAESYREEMKKVKNLKSKIMVREADDFLTATEFAEYRAFPNSTFSDDASFYAYGDKLALITFHENSVQIIVLKNKKFADSFRTMFYAVWNSYGAQT